MGDSSPENWWGVFTFVESFFCGSGGYLGSQMW